MKFWIYLSLVSLITSFIFIMVIFVTILSFIVSWSFVIILLLTRIILTFIRITYFKIKHLEFYVQRIYSKLYWNV